MATSAHAREAAQAPKLGELGTVIVTRAVTATNPCHLACCHLACWAILERTRANYQGMAGAHEQRLGLFGWQEGTRNRTHAACHMRHGKCLPWSCQLRGTCTIDSLPSEGDWGVPPRPPSPNALRSIRGRRLDARVATQQLQHHRLRVQVLMRDWDQWQSWGT